MLKGISPLISPELLKVLSEMGHGDEIILADAHFPSYTFNSNVIRLDGIKIDKLLLGVLALLELDSYVPHPLIMMSVVKGDKLDIKVEESYLKNINPFYPKIDSIKRIDRFDFYDRAKKAFAIVVTGETAKYGNILLKKGVTPME